MTKSDQSHNRPPIVVIIGPTASGKTSLAVRLAKMFDGEVICADSRTVYQGLDIGTAKPTSEEQEEVPHWGLDIVKPDQIFTAASFKDYAIGKIEEIRARGRVPFLVGGTGLYVDSVLFNFSFVANRDDKMRQELESRDIEYLLKYCQENNIKLPSNHQNKRQIIRQIERNSISGKRSIDPVDNFIVVGISTPKNILRTKIEYRVGEMIARGVVEEATQIASVYGWNNQALTGDAYRIIKSYLSNETSREDLPIRMANSDWQLAKRQMTWFRRNPYIAWAILSDAEKYIVRQLSKYE